MNRTPLLAFLALFALTGCTAINHRYIICATSTITGMAVAQNPTTEMYEGKFGYDRTEVALVPVGTNGSVPDVLMEYRMYGILSFNAGLYQRLAVGPNAVQQPGASLMFAKDAKGNLVSTNSTLLNLMAPRPAK